MSIIPTPVLRHADSDKNAYRGLAMSQMRILIDYMKLAGLNTFSRTVELANGVIITCNKNFDREDVSIDLPVGILDREPHKFEFLGFVCQPRLGSLKLRSAAVNYFLSISYYCIDNYGYDKSRTDIKNYGTVVYPLVDGDDATSVLGTNADNQYFQPTGMFRDDKEDQSDNPQDYGNLDWKSSPDEFGNVDVLTWQGAHSRHGTQYDIGIGNLYSPLYARHCYHKGKAQLDLPLRPVVPKDYTNNSGYAPGYQSWSPLYDQEGNTIELLVYGCAFSKNGDDKWLLCAAATRDYMGSYIFATQVQKNTAEDWKCPVGTWLLAGLDKTLRINNSVFFSGSGSKAVACENWWQYDFDITFESGFPSCIISQKNTLTNESSYTNTPAVTVQGTSNNSDSDGPNTNAGENLSGVFAADYIGEELVTATVTQAFIAVQGNNGSTRQYATIDGHHRANSTSQATPRTQYDCVTTLNVFGTNHILQEAHYSYRLDYTSASGYDYEGWTLELTSIWSNYNNSFQGVTSYYNSTLAGVLLLDLRHNLLVITARSSKTSSSTGTRHTANWTSYGTAYTVPGHDVITTEAIVDGPHDSGHTTTVWKDNKIIRTISGGDFLGLQLYSKLISQQGVYFAPGMPDKNLMLLGIIYAYYSNHPVGSFCVNTKGEYFYSFVINDQVANGCSAMDDKTLDKNTYNTDTPADAANIQKAYFPISLL